MAKRVALPQSKLKKQRRQRRVRLAIIIAAAVFAFAGAMVGATWIPYVRIDGVEVAGTETQNPGDIDVLTRETLRGAYFFIIPKNNIFLYPRQMLLGVLRSRYPAVKEFKVRAKNFHTIEVAVVERRPVAVWCGESPDMSEDCRLMDENGFAYAPAASFSGDAYVRYFGRATTTEGYVLTEAPKKFLTPAEFRSLAALTAAFTAHQGTNGVTGIAVDASDDVKLTFANGFSVLFLLKESGGDVFERFTLALRSEPFAARQLSEIEYLDLRFGDKLYYHLKNK